MAQKGIGQDWGNLFAKPDIERLGLFLEMPWMHGKRYIFQKMKQDKGKSMLGLGPKIKTGKQDCYFDQEFKRLFIGEALRGKRKLPPPKLKNVTDLPFMPTGPSKWHSTPGDNYGTFSAKTEAFSNVRTKKAPYKREPANFIGGHVKFGGPGYVDICINPYPSHSVNRYGYKRPDKKYGQVLNGPLHVAHYPRPSFGPDPYKEYEKMKPGPVYVPPVEKAGRVLGPGIFMPTGPAKWQGGSHAGCFDKFPEHKPEKYRTQYELNKPKKHTGIIFYPQSSGEKTYYTVSVVNENLRFRVNTSNSSSYEPNYINHLVGPNFIR